VKELEDGGETDGVVYLGRSGFKMKVGVRMTPPGGTKPVSPVPVRTPPPSARTPLPSAQTQAPPPTARTPRPAPVSSGRPPTQLEIRLGREVSLTKAVLIGLCLIAFSSGIITTIAVDRFWPTARTDCGGTAPRAGVVPTGLAPGIGAVPGPAAAPAAVVAPLPPPVDPGPADQTIALVPVPEAPGQSPAASTAPAATRATASRVPPGRSVTRLTPAQGRPAARKRPAAAQATTASGETMPPTGVWIDPFSD
jgi:hypothetical protein